MRRQKRVDFQITAKDALGLASGKIAKKKKDNIKMAKCYISGKSHRTGNNVSHAVNRTKRRFKLNLQKVRIRDENGNVKRVRVCAKYIKSGLIEKA